MLTAGIERRNRMLEEMDRLSKKHGSKAAGDSDKKRQDNHDITLRQALEEASERGKNVIWYYPSSHD